MSETKHTVKSSAALEITSALSSPIPKAFLRLINAFLAGEAKIIKVSQSKLIEQDKMYHNQAEAVSRKTSESCSQDALFID